MSPETAANAVETELVIYDAGPCKRLGIADFVPKMEAMIGKKATPTEYIKDFLIRSVIPKFKLAHI
ncbi:hypothetical protein OUZ56_007641 [Daphnia magna]|uniref:Uncharacterized protein n=1 Tax=Daphnia magna TaxID=35525 RepID=A0ABR0AAJ3_9CRUS|nr:hypothetical protein OUZ56_007641 [Daphnia magna]